jgi:hypothetical protein
MPSNVKASSLGSVKDNHMNLVFDSFLVVSRMTLSVCDSSQLLLKGLQGTWDTKRNGNWRLGSPGTPRPPNGQAPFLEATMDPLLPGDGLRLVWG